MRIYFSANRTINGVPEVLIPETRPNIMLTFFEIDQRITKKRLGIYFRSKKKK